MKNSQLLKMLGGIMAAIGAIVSGVGVKLRNEASATIDALVDGGDFSGYSSSTIKSIAIWEEHLQNRTLIMVVGIIVLVVGVILFIAGVLKANAARNPETQSFSDNSTVTAESAAARLKKLQELREQNIISEDEYNVKRQEMLSDL